MRCVSVNFNNAVNRQIDHGLNAIHNYIVTKHFAWDSRVLYNPGVQIK